MPHHAHLPILVMLAALVPGAEAPARIPRPFFAYCMDTADSAKRDLASQAAMLKELGYAGGGHCWPFATVGERIRTLDAAGLKTVHIYATAKLKVGAPLACEPAMVEVIPLLRGHGVQIAYGIQAMRGLKTSDVAGDADAVALVHQLAALAEPVGATVVLYPHVGFWMERLGDAVRIARQVDRPNVGVMWNLCHWLRVEGDGDLEAALRDALPLLRAVSINGGDTRAELAAAHWPLERWIRPLGQGTYDVAPVLTTLDRLGWQGPVCLQCYGIRGDARDHLAASMAAWRRLNPIATP